MTNPATILIAGANRGLGLALARYKRTLGFTVIGCCRAPEKAGELAEIGAEVVPLDMADSNSIAALGERLRDRPVDVVIANAGVLGSVGQLGAVDGEDFIRTIRVNALGPLLLSRALLPSLLAGDGKRFVAVSSRMGSIVNALEEGGDYAYRCSKTALNMAMATLSHELRAKGVAVALVHPGWAMTDMGGPDADVPVADSAAGICQVIEGLSLETSGTFLSWTGERIAW